jgi:hypothetical protein
LIYINKWGMLMFLSLLPAEMGGGRQLRSLKKPGYQQVLLALGDCSGPVGGIELS